MAPKRKTGGSRGGSAKVRKVEEPEPVKTEQEIQMDLLKASLQDEKYPVEGPETNRQLLVNLVSFALAEVQEHRHEFQNKMINECLEVALLHIDNHLKEEVDAQQKVQDTAEIRRQELEADRLAAEQDLEAKAQDLEEKQDVLKAKKETLKETQDLVKGAQSEQDETEELLSQKEERKELLRHACQDLFEPMVTSAAEKAPLKELMAVLETMNLDQSFLSASPTALRRGPTERGMFDNMSVNHLGEQFELQRRTVDEEIHETNATLTAKKAATEEAEGNRDAAQTEKDTADDSMKEATDVKKAAAAHLKDCEKAIKEHEKDVDLAAQRKLDAEAEVEEFVATLSAYRSLRDRSLPKEPDAEASVPEETEGASAEVDETVVEESAEQPIEPMQVEVECA